MQFLICEGCDLREKSCIIVDQGPGIDQTGYPSTCLFDNHGKVFGERKWNTVDGTDIILGFLLKGLQIIAGKGGCKSCGEIKVLNDKKICFECSKRS